MTNSDLRNTVRSYIDNADERFLKMIKAMAENYEENNQVPYLNENQLNELDLRRANYLANKGKTYTWEEVKEQITRSNNV
jgi:putative addiction module component (TIGR02574 family)